MNSLPSLFVSVIIPVYNDAERLKVCLAALENQTYPKDLYEVIVADNASDEAQDIKGVVAQFGCAIATYESLPGSYAARNQGISLAKGDVIAFTDSDCIPAPNWIENGVKNLLQVPNCGLVAGKMEIFCKNPEKPTPVELYESITAFPQQQLLETKRGGATGNLFTFKNVIDRVGVFNANLKSNGDLEWGQRVYSAGYQQVYADDTCVAHPARSSFKELYKRTVRLVGGSYDWQNQKQLSFSEKNLFFFKFLWENVIPPLNFVFNAFKDNRLENIDSKIKVCWVMFCVRYISAWEIIRLKLGGVSAR
ncbi:glycosyltransferase [Microseira sp. BLCC-F43]|jgi:glycosyltransferase involved in cell wall biosynthesis|uniref:glycosyltransferase n=1 Tax=Microseira sp. BLCC-F43 TaxID=3153602 RepID=UPI0035BB3F03